MGLGSGIAGYGVNWGVEFIPVSAMWRSVIFGGTGLLASLALAKWGDLRVGAGMGGAVGALLTGRIVTLVKLQQVGSGASSSTTTPTATTTETSGIIRQLREGGRVYSESGRVYQRESGAPTTLGRQVFGRSFKETAASQFTRGPVRFFGPQSWAANEGGVVYRSKHSPNHRLR
jgi:hypothetical protein